MRKIPWLNVCVCVASYAQNDSRDGVATRRGWFSHLTTAPASHAALREKATKVAEQVAGILFLAASPELADESVCPRSHTQIYDSVNRAILCEIQAVS
jgi:hypothetical protein